MRTSRRIGLLAACLMCLCSSPVRAELVFDGTVVAGETVSVTAPFGGTVQAVFPREGENIAAGDTVAHLQGTRVYAPLDGTVRGLKAQPGDSVEQAVLSIAPVSKYTIQASVEAAYESVESKYVTVGETLYIRCVKDGSHRALGRVTACDGLNYTVETQAGELYMEERVYLYRSPACEKTERVGSGTVSRTSMAAVDAAGSLLEVYVEEGETVERGQLLFETVEGELEGLKAPERAVSIAQDGIVASVDARAGDTVKAGDALATVYTRAGLQIEIQVPETMLGQVTPGRDVDIAFYKNAGQSQSVPGVISAVSFLPKDGEAEGTVYSAYIDFDAGADIGTGMTAYVTLRQQDE